MRLIETALWWLGQGIAVLPCKYRMKVPDTLALRRGSGQSGWEQYQTKLPNYRTLKNWFVHDSFNLGVITGWRGLVVLDFESIEWYDLWRATYPDLHAYTVRTARGMHAYLFINEPVQAHPIRGILDVKAAGGYVLAPPSVHPSGALYQVTVNAPIARVNSLDDVLPAGLFDYRPTTGQVAAPVQPLSIWERLDRAGPPVGLSVEEVKKRVSITDLLPDQEMTPTHDGYLITLCPLHDDHNPSFWIDTNRQLCGCFACGDKSMDVVNLYAQMHGIDNSSAIKELAKYLQ